MFYHTKVRRLGIDQNTGDEIPLRVQIELVVMDEQGYMSHVFPLYEYSHSGLAEDRIFS